MGGLLTPSPKIDNESIKKLADEATKVWWKKPEWLAVVIAITALVVAFLK